MGKTPLHTETENTTDNLLPNGKWYVVQVHANSEGRVADSIKRNAKNRGLLDKIFEVLVPAEKTIELRRGRRVELERRFLPSYVLIHCDLTDHLYDVIKNTSKVSGFLFGAGGKGKPRALSAEEISDLKKKMIGAAEVARSLVHFEIGDMIRVTEGPFASFNGTVEGVDTERERVKVTVPIFGRPTPLELEYAHVEKTN
jgi:transcriptional antiterminator NusG